MKTQGSGPFIGIIAIRLLKVALLQKCWLSSTPSTIDLERSDVGDIRDRSIRTEVHVVGFDDEASFAQRGHAPSEALDASFKELPLELEVGRLAALSGEPFKTVFVKIREPGTAVVSLDDDARCLGEHRSIRVDEPPLPGNFAENPRRARHRDDVRRQPV